VFGDCEEVRRVGMAHIRKLYELLHKAEEHMRTKSDAVSTALKVLFKDMHWQNLQISLECLAVAHEANYDFRENQVREQAFSLFAGPSETKTYCEDVFGHLAHVVQRSQKGRQVMNKLLA
jgi:hypothetical protein